MQHGVQETLRRICLVAAAALACASVHAVRPKKPPRPATQPAPTTQMTVAFAKSSAQAAKAYKEGTLAAYRQLAVAELRDAMKDPKAIDDGQVVRLASMSEFARRFAAIANPTADESRTIDWLVQDTAICPLFMTALCEQDDVRRAVGVLTALRKEHGRKVDDFPELTVAAALVWDSPAAEGQTAPQCEASAVAIFGHVTERRKALRMDATGLPWPIEIYLVNSHISPDERAWAVMKYRLKPQPGQAYFDVRYDMAGLSSGVWGNGQRIAYSLPNILARGGVCKDQAYFASEVIRAWGIPATIVTGQASQGQGFHAWVGYLVPRGKTINWDFNTARYPEHGYWSGTVIDPQSGAKLADRDVAMTAEWCNVSTRDRLTSLAITRALEVVPAEQRLAFCKLALDKAPANRDAWMALADECAKPTTTPQAFQEIAFIVQKFAVGRYDDFAFKMYQRLISGRKPEEQFAAIDRAIPLFNNRPDLVAEMELLRGDALQKANRPVDAMKLYQGLLQKYIEYGPILLTAMEKADAMLRTAGQLPELARMYNTVWTRMKEPDATGYAWTTPWYLIGARYAAVLRDLNDLPTAARVRKTIAAKDLSGQPPP